MADAIVTVGGCDKTNPGVLMPIARGNHIGITVYGGTALSGKSVWPFALLSRTVPLR